MTRSCDVIVVGAGPAGSVAALVLARAGVKVRLLDRSSFPRPKLCGDTLNPGALAILERLGGPDGPPLRGSSPTAVAGHRSSPAVEADLQVRLALEAPLAARIRARALALTGMTVTGPAGEYVAADYPGGLTGAALTRSDLDLLLVEAAAAAGVVVDTQVRVHEPLLSDDAVRVTGVRLKSGGRDQRIDARLVIAADGRGSRLASALGLSSFAREPRRWAFGAYFEGVTDLSSRGEMHIRKDGYIGVAPLPGGVANVCVVRENPRADQRRLVPDAVARDPRLRDRFARALQVSETVVLGPLAIDSRAAGCPGLLLAGDAAGFVDPMTGDGLRFALSGGELAALAALRELASGLPEWRRLGAERTRQFSAKWRINRTLRATVGSPHALGLAARVARTWPASVAYLIGVAGDVALARP